MKLPTSSKNWLTIIGSIIAAINLILILLLFVISTIFDKGNTNLGLFIYIILPGFLLFGLLLIPLGMFLEQKKIFKSLVHETARLPYLDLNDPSHRNAFFIFTITTIVILFLSTLGSFKAYHITESVEFCGTLCHQVMEPEHTAYLNSPHANVACVECHVGSGASWYVKSKLSGLRQVYAVLTNTYPRPIVTPLHDLRPARETCEKCHWPQKFYARSLWTNKYYLADSANTEWDIMLQMKTGPEYSGLGLREGIHWHINPDVKIEYISENDKRENITFVKYTNKSTGKVTIYRNASNPVSDSLIAAASTRTMDCIDCHNRPSHNYNSPTVYFNKAMLTGAVSKSIPFFKKAAMDILREAFTDRDTAMMKINESITGFYKTEHGEYYEKNKDMISSSIASVQKAFNQNTFPKMKVSYDNYPEHIGHLESEGCFRCHNNSFKSDDGRIISKDCNQCHSIVGQGTPGAMQFTNIRRILNSSIRSILGPPGKNPTVLSVTKTSIKDLFKYFARRRIMMFINKRKKTVFAFLIFLFNCLIIFGQDDPSSYLKTGDMAPAFICKTIDGKAFDLSKARGKIVMINFFATWCGPCNQELPVLQQTIWEKYMNNPNFELIVLGREHTEKEVKNFVIKHKFTMPFAPDPGREIFKLYASQNIPRNVIVGKDGKIIFQNNGFSREEFSNIEKLIEENVK